MIPARLHYIFFCLSFGIIYLYPVSAQQADYFLGPRSYSFIKYDQNQIILPADTHKFDTLFNRLERIEQGNNEQIRILHMGGSHIQADIYTQRIRMRMQQLSPDMAGSRGLIFPFRMAKTNNPSNFRVSYTGNWETCKSTQANESCTLGLTGMAVYTSDTEASVSIQLVNGVDYYSEFDSVRVFHEPSGYQLRLICAGNTIEGRYDSLSGCTSFQLAFPASQMKLEITRMEQNSSFSLLGISLDSHAPGIVYDAVGVNGAKLSSYLNSDLYEKHLGAIHPDLIIISIGTNDGYTRRFNEELYYEEYKALIELTRAMLPEAAIIITVPNDSYLYRKYVNPNTEEIRKVIFRLAREFQCGLWDFYAIMGGLNSAQSWYSLNLMKDDRIHFTRRGYEIKGELFFSAFLKEWEKGLWKNSAWK